MASLLHFESPYLSLPYGSPSSGQFFGPASIGGPPGSRINRNSYKLRNTLSAQIVQRLQQRFANDFGENVHTSQSSTEATTTNFTSSLPLIQENVDNPKIVSDKSRSKHDKRPQDLVIDDCHHIEIDSCSDELQTTSLCEFQNFPFEMLDKENVNDKSNSLLDILFMNKEEPITLKEEKLSSPGINLSFEAFFEACEKVSQDRHEVIVPPSPFVTELTSSKSSDFHQKLHLSEEECRKAMKQYSSKRKCCFGKRPAIEHTVMKIKQPRNLHYTLETFSEQRSVQYSWQPCDFDDTCELKSNTFCEKEIPSPWSIECQPETLFQPHSKKLKIPCTTKIKECHDCDGKKVLACKYCLATGIIECTNCMGEGTVEMVEDKTGVSSVITCCACNGSKNISCVWCKGGKLEKCDTCGGQGQLKCFLQLNVNYKTTEDKYILEDTDLPQALHHKVTDETLLFHEQLPQVFPILDYPLMEVVDNTILLHEKHKSLCKNEKIILQRHNLWVLPVHEVLAEWKGISYKYWVYGEDHKVFCPDYPYQRCNCFHSQTCTVL